MKGNWWARAQNLSVLGMLVMWLVVGVRASEAEGGNLLNQIEEERAAILESNRPCVVRIHTIYSHPKSSGLGKGFTHGTGFIFDSRGYILTVEQAVRDAEEIRVTLSSGKQMQATLVATDPASEVAVIRVKADSLVAARIGNSDQVRVGHFAFILGNTFGNLTPAFGSVHDINRKQDLIQVMAPVHPSYGGAPVFCSTGAVIGMVWGALDPWASFRKDGEEIPADLMGWQEVPTTVFVIPINRAIRIARRLTSRQEVAYGWLGIEGEDNVEGVKVTDVASGGPAAESGMRPGDVILAYHGRPVLGLWHFVYMVLATPPGTVVPLEIKRGKKEMLSKVEVGRMAPKLFSEIVASMASGGAKVSNRQVELMERELDGLRQALMQSDTSRASARVQSRVVPVVSQSGSVAANQKQEVLLRRIDKLQQQLQQELLQLRQQLMEGRQPPLDR